MKSARDALYRCAQQTHRQLAKLASAQADRRRCQVADVCAYCCAVSRLHKQVERATQHGWPLAAANLRVRLLLDVHQIQEAAADLLRFQNQTFAPVPPLPLLIDELRGLRLEFEDVVFEPRKNRIAVRTEPLVLEDQHLGPFSIELHLDRLSREPGSGCFECIALEPNPAEGNPSVTHPHVKDGGLCAGDATTPIKLALSQGRLCDAFMLVAGVLRSYNAGSPFVSLDDWTGSSCPECGESCGQDELYFCEGCEHDVCDGCSSHCDLCDRSMCLSCLEHDEISGKDCCANCYEKCRECRRVVDCESVDVDSGLCPECLAKPDEAPSNNPEESSDETTSVQQQDQPRSVVAV